MNFAQCVDSNTWHPAAQFSGAPICLRDFTLELHPPQPPKATKPRDRKPRPPRVTQADVLAAFLRGKKPALAPDIYKAIGWPSEKFWRVMHALIAQDRAQCTGECRLRRYSMVD